MKRQALSPRRAAVQAIDGVRLQGQSLASLIPQLETQVPATQRGVFKALTFGTVRWLPKLQAQLRPLLQKPLPAKEHALEALLLTGIYQLNDMDTPAHRVVNDCVDESQKLGKRWAKGLVNGVLRNYLRQRDEIDAQVSTEPATQEAHPRWMVRQLQQDWPEQWRAVLAANNARAPMSLRVNLRQQTRDAYLQTLREVGIAGEALVGTTSGVVLDTPCGVDALPGFEQGAVSVQDQAAQMAAHLLDVQVGERVLDACAAPGGKTAHLQEWADGQLDLTALDAEADRLQRAQENLSRLKLAARFQCADAAAVDTWWDGIPFDAILLDAPCSGTGVVRRNPDIKWLRKSADIDTTAELQARILRQLWQTLKPGGRLLYATCSVCQRENSEQIESFLQSEQTASTLAVTLPYGRRAGAGWQVLPGEGQMDGFFYAMLQKQG